MPSPRYAIYLAPPPDTPLWAFGSRVLGYNAVSGQTIFGFAPHGIDSAEWRRMTERPRLYGFHATLKAPFQLAAGCCEDEIFTALDVFCRKQLRFDLGPLAVEAFSDSSGVGFVALTQKRLSQELQSLEHDAVRAFDHFRAPLSDDDLKRRKPETLTSRQKESLLRFGYPFVGPDYRFHMTLSGEIPDAADIADRLADAMANEIGTAHLDVEALVLFRQANATERFSVLRRYDFLGVSPRLTAATLSS